MIAVCATLFTHDTLCFLNPKFKTNIMIAVSITFFVFTNDRFTENRNEIQSIINKRYYLFLRLALHKTNNKFVFGAASRQPDKEYHQSQTFRVCIK